MQRGRESGHTLLEVLVVLTISAVLLVVLGTTIQAVFAEGMVTATSEEAVARVLDRVVSEVQDAQLSTIVLSDPVDARSITYSNVNGWTGPGPSVAAAQTISFDSGRVLHDGLVIADGVSDLFFNLNGSVLTVTLRVDQALNVQGRARTIAREMVSKLKL